MHREPNHVQNMSAAPKDDPHDHPRTVAQQSDSTAESTSPTHIVISEPKANVMIVHDSFGRVTRRPGVHSHPQGTSTTTTTSDLRNASQPSSTQTSATVVDVHNRSQDTVPRSLSLPFVDTCETTAALSLVPQMPPTHRLLSAGSTGSLQFPAGTTACILSLSTSPRGQARVCQCNMI